VTQQQKTVIVSETDDWMNLTVHSNIFSLSNNKKSVQERTGKWN